MMSKENIISLVMKRDNSSTGEIGLLREKACKHARNCLPDSCAKVVKNYLRIMFRRLAGILKIFIFTSTNITTRIKPDRAPRRTN